MLFFSCSKASEKTEEPIVSEPSNETESSDADSDGPEPVNVPAEPEEKPASVLESVVPEDIRRPQQGEALRFPEDRIIGALGEGEAPIESYRFAEETLVTLLREAEQAAEQAESREQNNSQSVLSNLQPEEQERILSILQELSPEEIRIGGGKEDIDGSVSFLLRFMGNGSWSGGEIYVRQNEDVWNVEDLILDESRGSDESTNPYRFDFPPYERFF